MTTAGPSSTRWWRPACHSPRVTRRTPGRQRSRAALAAGPRAADAAEVDVRRYTLSGLVDDLEGGADPAEEYVVQAAAFREAAELALLIDRRWLGSGKWLVRNLRTGDDHGLVAWASAGGDRDRQALLAACRRALDAAGGYLQDGYVRGERPRTTDPAT